MRRLAGFTMPLVAILTLTLCLAASSVHAGPFDKIKKKVEKKIDEKSDAAADGTAKKSADKPDGTSAGKRTKGGEDAVPSAPAKSASDEKVSSISTKFDYVPGDSVILFDDFTQDELGEFPARWRLSGGTFEVVEREGERWLRCVSVDGRVRMKLPNLVTLPEFWTLEFDFYGEEPLASSLTLLALSEAGASVWETTYPVGGAMMFRTGEILSSTPFEGANLGGRHHVMFMARGTGVKVYLDRQRMASVPEVATRPGTPSTLEFRLWAATKPMISNVRFAEGCRPAKDMLAEGRLVTYGIHFETGSDVVQAESAPVLRQIASYLEANATVKLRIVGHTDNVGPAASNLDLSKHRAAAVARVLSGEFNVAAERFVTDGGGDAQPVASNAKPEGRAMNRRVEFIKR
jgi:outer membrane protein OmpA-like peptidoglycan-associated protein